GTGPQGGAAGPQVEVDVTRAGGGGDLLRPGEHLEVPAPAPQLQRARAGALLDPHVPAAGGDRAGGQDADGRVPRAAAGAQLGALLGPEFSAAGGDAGGADGTGDGDFSGAGPGL